MTTLVKDSHGIGVVNDGHRWEDGRWLFSFGAYGDTHVLVLGFDGVYDALEAAAEWLAKYAPGHLMAHDSDELKELYREACDEHEVSYEELARGELDGNPEADEVEQTATTDLTYTESGYLTSCEWFVTEAPTREHILSLQRRNAA